VAAVRATMEKHRERFDLSAKASAALGATAAGAVGLARIGDLFPLPPGQVSALWFGLAILGFAGMTASLFAFTFRLWSVNKPIIMRTDIESMTDLDERERREVKHVYDEMAELNNVASLEAYASRGRRFRRLAETASDPAKRKGLEDKAAEVEGEVDLTLARGALRVLRRRSSNAIRGLGSIVALATLVASVVVFALGTDYVSSERTEDVAIGKSCADARKAGAKVDTLPAICREDPPKKASAVEESSPSEETAKAAEALTLSLQQCLGTLEQDEPTTPCEPIVKSLQTLLAGG
jgi:hypothetical protein